MSYGASSGETDTGATVLSIATRDGGAGSNRALPRQGAIPWKRMLSSRSATSVQRSIESGLRVARLPLRREEPLCMTLVDDVITTPRLKLISLTPPLLQAIASGDLAEVEC
jgi:hypothetical protein